MTGGHVLVATLLIFAGSAISSASAHGGIAGNGIIFLISTAGAVAIMFLELFRRAASGVRLHVPDRGIYLPDGSP
jgi:hypothetical protein